MESKVVADYKEFLDRWFGEIDKLGIDYSKWRLDHLGYGVSSGEEYDKLKNELRKTGVIRREVLVSERRVGVMKLNAPLVYRDWQIWAVEIIEPVAGESRETGFEHAEFTISEDFESVVEQYSNLAWDTKNIRRADFPRLKLVLATGLELKLNHKSILED